MKAINKIYLQLASYKIKIEESVNELPEPIFLSNKGNVIKQKFSDIYILYSDYEIPGYEDLKDIILNVNEYIMLWTYKGMIYISTKD